MREKYRTFDAPIKDQIIDGEVVWDSSHSKEETSKKLRQYVPLYVPDNSTADVFGTTKTTTKYKDNFFSMCRLELKIKKMLTTPQNMLPRGVYKDRWCHTPYVGFCKSCFFYISHPVVFIRTAFFFAQAPHVDCEALKNL